MGSAVLVHIKLHKETITFRIFSYGIVASEQVIFLIKLYVKTFPDLHHTHTHRFQDGGGEKSENSKKENIETFSIIWNARVFVASPTITIIIIVVLGVSTSLIIANPMEEWIDLMGGWWFTAASAGEENLNF